MVANNDSGGYGTNQITVCDNQCFNFMTGERMTFDECTAKQRKSLLQPKRSVSTMNIEDLCGRDDTSNIKCEINKIRQTFLLHQLT
jgi:hypothetical protein